MEIFKKLAGQLGSTFSELKQGGDTPLLQQIERSPRFVPFFLAGVVLLLWGLTCGLWDLTAADEGRYALIGKELLGRSNWLLLTIYGQPYDQKPPLPFWLFGLMAALNGGEVSAWLQRLPSVLFAAVTLVSTYKIGRVRLGESGAMASALILMTSAQFIDDAPAVELNMMFTGWITLSLAAWLTRPESERMGLGRTVLMWGALAGAFFTKGPLAIFIVLAAVFCEAAGHRSWKVLRACRPLIGLTSLFLLIGGWLWAQKMAAGGEFVAEQVKGQTWERFFHGSHEAPFWYYLTRLMTSIFAPWGVLLIPAGITLWKGRRNRLKALDPILGMVLLSFLLLSIASGKRQSYMTPLIPGMALIVGWYIQHLDWKTSLFPRVAQAFKSILLVVSVLMMAVAVVLLARMDFAWRYEFYIVKSSLSGAIILGLVALQIVLWLHSGPPTLRRLVWGGAAAVLIIAMVNFTVIKPALNPKKTTRIFANQVTGLMREYDAGNVLYALEKADKPEYHVYGSYRVRPVDEDELVDHPDIAVPGLMVVRERDWAELGSSVEAAGYRRLKTLEASGDELIVVGRIPAARMNRDASVVRLVALGDTGTSKDVVHTLASRIATEHDTATLDAVLLLGDNLYGHDLFQESISERFEEPFKLLIERKIPFVAALGNHDHRDDILEGEIEYEHFGMEGRRYYAKTFGNGLVEVFVLDSEIIKRDPNQIAWLRSILKNCEATWKILVLHHPMLASEVGHGPDLELYRLLSPVMTGEQDIDLVLTGHNHIYERRKVTDDILHVTIGCGGQTEEEEDGFPEDAGREVGFDRNLAFLVMEIKNDLLVARVINEMGVVMDQFHVKDTEEPDGVIVGHLQPNSELASQ